MHAHTCTHKQAGKQAVSRTLTLLPGVACRAPTPPPTPHTLFTHPCSPSSSGLPRAGRRPSSPPRTRAPPSSCPMRSAGRHPRSVCMGGEGEGGLWGVRRNGWHQVGCAGHTHTHTHSPACHTHTPFPPLPPLQVAEDREDRGRGKRRKRQWREKNEAVEREESAARASPVLSRALPLLARGALGLVPGLSRGRRDGVIGPVWV